MKDLSSSRKNYRICLGINAIKSDIFASLGTISREYYQIKNEKQQKDDLIKF